MTCTKLLINNYVDVVEGFNRVFGNKIVVINNPNYLMAMSNLAGLPWVWEFP